jgi:hypothetical protein
MQFSKEKIKRKKERIGHVCVCVNLIAVGKWEGK